jgi:hypothetical protein
MCACMCVRVIIISFLKKKEKNEREIKIIHKNEEKKSQNNVGTRNEKQNHLSRE